MKASEFLRSAIDQYKEEVSGGGEKIEVESLGLEFWVFPVQPADILYINKDLPPYDVPEVDWKDTKEIDEKTGELKKDDEGNVLQVPDIKGELNRNVRNDNMFYFEYAIRLITGRARDERGHSIFNNAAERDKAAEMLRTKSPKAFDASAAVDVINQIQEAFNTTSIEDATKNSEAVPTEPTS